MQEILKLLAHPLVSHRPVITSLFGRGGASLGNDSTSHYLATSAAHHDLLKQTKFTADLLYTDCRKGSVDFESALEFASKHAEGLMLADRSPLSQHIWADVTVIVPGQQPFNALYFAKARQSMCFHGTADGLFELADVVQRLKRQRLQYRRGPETTSYLQTTDTVIAWDAAQGELNNRRSGQRRHNVTMRAGVLNVQFSPFDRRCGADLGLIALNGKTMQQVVMNRPLRQLLSNTAGRTAPDVISAYRTALRAAVAQLRTLRAGIPKTGLPAGLVAALRPYQKDGFDFLAHLAKIGHGGILADDMGLGKTLQTLAWLLWLKSSSSSSSPSLVICPASVMHNWRREAEKFTPGLKVMVLESGPGRAAQLQRLAKADIVVTNYALLRRDLATLSKTDWRTVVLDEAQFIKNPDAQIARSVKQLTTNHRLALTGTPLENCLLDLWSIVDFVQPGYLGNRAEFKETFESGDPVAARKGLARRLRPLMLRRLKKDVATDLPGRVERRHDCHLGSAQMAFYKQELQRSRKQVFDAVDQHGLKRSKMHVLAAITHLRQICCHPQLVGDGSPSGKMTEFFELLESLIKQQKKILVFSQFTRMLELLQAECRRRGIKNHLLTGDTRDRQSVVNAFNGSGDAPVAGSVFLLSLRAAGTGLNLTTASEVILYDPWWNPAVEAQAIDRSHRIGQTATVNAHRLITRGTIEERIWTIQQSKARTIGEVLGDGGGFTRKLTKTDLEYLFGGVESEGSSEQKPTQYPRPNGTVLFDSETKVDDIEQVSTKLVHSPNWRKRITARN